MSDCKICDIDCRNRFEILYHYDIEHKNICALCNLQAFNNKSERFQHLREVHNLHPCKTCWRAFDNLEKLQAHFQASPNSHKYTCNECDEECDTNTNFWAHRILAHESICPVCDDTVDFSQKLGRDCHLKLKHNLFPCDGCWNVFVSSVALQCHYMDKHWFTCEMCDKTFNNKPDKDSHFALAHEIKCDACDKIFNTEAHFERHRNNEHLMKCPICNRTIFNNETDIATHFKLTHSVECFVCEEFFTSETQLKHHYNAKHRIECTLCDKVFHSKDTMKEHFKLAHILSCDLCEKICRTLDELQLHYNAVHHVGGLQHSSGDKDFHMCSACGGGFNTENDLLEHYEHLHVK